MNLTAEYLTMIYNQANEIPQGKAPPITTERIFNAMRLSYKKGQDSITDNFLCVSPEEIVDVAKSKQLNVARIRELTGYIISLASQKDHVLAKKIADELEDLIPKIPELNVDSLLEQVRYPTKGIFIQTDATHPTVPGIYYCSELPISIDEILSLYSRSLEDGRLVPAGNRNVLIAPSNVMEQRKKDACVTNNINPIFFNEGVGTVTCGDMVYLGNNSTNRIEENTACSIEDDTVCRIQDLIILDFLFRVTRKIYKNTLNLYESLIEELKPLQAQYLMVITWELIPESNYILFVFKHKSGEQLWATLMIGDQVPPRNLTPFFEY